MCCVLYTSAVKTRQDSLGGGKSKITQQLRYPDSQTEPLIQDDSQSILVSILDSSLLTHSWFVQ